MSTLICRKTMRECATPDMCAPYQGCGVRAPVQSASERPTDADVGRLPPIALSSIITYESPHGTLIRRADVECMLARLKAQGLTDAKDGALYRAMKERDCTLEYCDYTNARLNGEPQIDLDAAIERMTGNAGGEGA